MRTLAVILFSLAVLAAPAAAERYELSIGNQSRFMHAGSVDALTDDRSYGTFSMQAAFHLNQLTIPGGRLHLDVDFHTGGFRGTSFDRLETDTHMTGGAAGARITRDLSRYTRGFVRATLGLSRMTMTLSDDRSGADPLFDHAWAGTAYLGTGFDLMPLRRLGDDDQVRLALGLRIEGGYQRVTPVEMRARPESRSGDGDTLRIPMQEVSLGSLDLSAWILRVGFAGRF
jgi:hypothetical protein